MNITYEHKPAMTFIGFSTSIRPEEGYQKCPEFWDREYAQKYAHLWQTMQPENAVEKAILENHVGLFAICDEKKGSFEYWIAGIYQGGEVPEGQKYVGNGNAMLEVYSVGDMQSPDYECGIWVPVCKPAEQSEEEAAETVSGIMRTGIL